MSHIYVDSPWVTSKQRQWFTFGVYEPLVVDVVLHETLKRLKIPIDRLVWIAPWFMPQFAFIRTCHSETQDFCVYLVRVKSNTQRTNVQKSRPTPDKTGDTNKPTKTSEHNVDTVNVTRVNTLYHENSIYVTT